VIRFILAILALCAAQPASAQPEDWTHRDRRDGVHLRILRDYELKAGETAFDPIVVLGGSASIDGRVEDDVVVVGGSLRVGPTAVIRGNVAAVGGKATIDPAAQIRGSVDETIVAGPDFDVNLGWLTGDWWWSAFAFGATVMRLGIILITALLLTVVAPDWIAGIARRVTTAPLGSAGIGIAGQILFVPAVVAVTVALVISIVGMMLFLAYPFVFGALALLWVAGFTGVATSVGSRLRGRHVATSTSPVADVIVGVLMISALTLAAQGIGVAAGAFGPGPWVLRAAGWFVEWLAWTIGLGAALASVFGGREPVTPPRLPYAAPAATPS
jgi:hypothetical protein